MEEIICVDLDDQITGYKEKLEAHRAPNLHRAFSVFLYHDDKMLIQMRNREKYHSGGLFANACCSHPRKGEELKDAAPRRLKQELGIECDVEEQFSFVYFSTYAKDLYEYEFDHVFLGEFDGELDFDPDEIDHVEWVTISDLKQRMVEHPENFATWFMIAAPKVIKIIEERKI